MLMLWSATLKGLMFQVLVLWLKATEIGREIAGC
jgi:hypothetical protein